MEPNDPLSQLASCCFGRRSRNAGGFKTAALRNQFLYSPSMAHMNPGGGGWPMTASGIAPTTIITSGLHPQVVPAQPYFLLTQPVIVNSAGQLESLQAHNTRAPTFAVLQQQPSPGQISAIQSNIEPSPLHKVPSIMPSQYNIYAATEGLHRLSLIQPHQPPMPSLIYQSPSRQCGQPNVMSRNISGYLDQQRQQAQAHSIAVPSQHKQCRRRLNSELYKRLELIEKQIDLSEDMDLVERHGIVITRPIEPITLAPHLTDEMLAFYQDHFLLDEESVIKFIEIIKRPGQTLGLYIRAVHFENPKTRMVREGIVITKIESDSPVYSSRVLQIGGEILSINLIDIQGMVLDDVVTLMSIPKRLVLVLRIPKERVEQEAGCEMLRQGDRKQDFRYHHVSGQGGSYTRQVPNHAMHAVYQAEKIHEQTQEDLKHRLAQISETRLNFEGVSDQQSPAHLHLARPARVPSAMSDDVASNVNFGSAMTGERALSMRTNEPFLANQHKTRLSPDTGTSELTFNETSGNSRMQVGLEQPRSPGVSRLDRQIAISQSMEISRNEDLDRFHNYSMDPEIAKLEREALIRDRPSDIEAPNLRGLDEQDQHRSYSSTGNNPPRKVDQTTSSTLPRRTLPTRPDQASSPTDAFSPISALNSTIISNIRLGETSEQSNYFTSSIDAINRELKELRRQRLAMSPCNESASIDAPAENPALS